MDPSSPPPESQDIPPRVVDSPWFWLYAFSMFALAALMIVGSKFGPRQASLERQFQGREEHGLVTPRGDRPDTLSSADNTIISLRPLYFIAGLLVTIGGSIFWWTHWFRGERIHKRDPSKHLSQRRKEK